MVVLQIEHKIPDFERWKKAFYEDPINRKKSGVRHFRIFRPVGDPNYVIIDLEFAGMEEANGALAALQELWGKVEGKIIMSPQTRMLNLVEATDL
jgi:hypothetical protein